MATLLELDNAGSVFRIDPALGPREQESRRIYVLPELQRWLQDELLALGSTWKIEQSPQEQLDALVAIYCSGDTLTYNWHFRPLNNLGDGIWEMKTADLRVFGWFPNKDDFIGVSANLTDQIKRLHMYRPYCEEAIRRRDELDLDEPKFIQGDDPNAVVSNFDFP